MPTFSYYCKRCKHSFDALVFNVKEVVYCPKCGVTKAKRVFATNSNAPRFKGPGFHTTDYVEKGK